MKEQLPHIVKCAILGTYPSPANANHVRLRLSCGHTKDMHYMTYKDVKNYPVLCIPCSDPKYALLSAADSSKVRP